MTPERKANLEQAAREWFGNTLLPHHASDIASLVTLLAAQRAADSQRIAQLEAEVARLKGEAVDRLCTNIAITAGIDWKAEAQWAATDLVNLMILRSPLYVLQDDPDYQRAKRILDGQL